MNSVQIFNNAEFGEIRTVIISGEPWFVGKDISERLGYVKTSNMLKLIEAEDKMMFEVSNMEPAFSSKVRSLYVISESGLYAAIFGSKQKNARMFQSWVTKEVLPSIRKTGAYGQSQLPTTTDGKIALLAQGHMELKEEVDTIKADLEALKMDLPILPIEAEKITEAVRRKGVEVLGGKTSNAYNDRSIRQKLYNNLYSNIKYNFGVRSYKAIKRSQCDKALEVISNFIPPIFLSEQIDNINAQQKLEW